MDIWRVRNSECKRFTWRQKNPFIQRRLDYWLLSDSYQEEVEGVDIISSINSDHSAIVLHFNSIEEQRHGPSYWKFNASLLDDPDFCKLITESVPECKRFTWRQKNPFIQRRLDYWLLSDSYQEEVEGVDIISSINSDHSAIVLHFNSIEEQRHGPSYWKFNASSLSYLGKMLWGVRGD